jgi:flavin-dependent dehydrogenase
VDVDLLVVGGGPVGLATAIEAARAGLSVAVVERRDGAVDKACGEGLMPGGRAALRRLGVEPEGVEFRGIRYLGGGRTATAEFSAGPGLGVRRTTLSAALAERADALGVKRVVGDAGQPVQSRGHVEAAGVQARYLAAADGLHSPLRRGLRLDRPARGAVRYGLRRHYRVAPWSDYVEVHWAADCEAYVTPVGPDTVGVAVLCPGGAPYDAWLARFPALTARLADAEPVSPVRGAGPLRRTAARRTAGRVLLVGDAAGYVDALTGEGISVGLACARELVRCVAADRPGDYERAWLRTTRRYRLMTGGLLAVAGRPALRRTIVPAAAALPRVFGGIVDRLG